MNKIIFLAISTLSFGVATFATIAPAVKAADTDTQKTATATITVNVPENTGVSVDTAAVNLGNLNTNGHVIATNPQKVTTANNTGNNYNLTVTTDTNDNNAMAQVDDKGAAVANGATIPAGTNITDNAAASAWGVKSDGTPAGSAFGTAFKAVSAKNATGDAILKLDTANAGKTTNVTYGVAANDSQAAGNYKVTVVYSYAEAS